MTVEVLPPEVRAWADETECGAGEEHERTWYPREHDSPFESPPDGTIQVWAESPADVADGQVVGMWVNADNERRAEVRLNVTPAQALELAADLIAVVMAAEERAKWAAEDGEPVSPPNWRRTTGGITDEEIAHADHPVSLDGGRCGGSNGTS